jgi:hypothetical protein
MDLGSYFGDQFTGCLSTTIHFDFTGDGESETVQSRVRVPD